MTYLSNSIILASVSKHAKRITAEGMYTIISIVEKYGQMDILDYLGFVQNNSYIIKRALLN